MIEHRPLRRLVVTFDAERYSHRDHDGQRDVQTGITEVMRAADPEQRLRSLEWDRQPQGDAILAVLPPGTVEAEAISDFIGGLYSALHHHNRSRNEAYRLRLRVSFDQGNIAVGDNGFVGNAVVAACRVRDSDLLRDALAHNPEADLVVAVSDSVYTDVVAHGEHELYRWEFTRRTAEAKNFSAPVWLHVPEVREDERGRGASPRKSPVAPTTDGFSFTEVDLRDSQGANLGRVGGDFNNHFG
ncbi:hypothetical protein [Nocardiopsis alba]|uniref:hypothetical protein n=1 Tax=Nocardiopsis alba TaxID=53437 RepID=UPI003643888E